MSPLAIAPTAQKRGIKNLLCIFAFGKKRKKLDIPHLRDCGLRPPNRRLLSRKTEFEFVCPFDLIPKYRAFCEARPAEGGASEQQNNPDFEKSLSWSGQAELNRRCIYPIDVGYHYPMARTL